MRISRSSRVTALGSLTVVVAAFALAGCARDLGEEATEVYTAVEDPVVTGTGPPALGTSADELPAAAVTFVTGTAEHRVSVRVAADAASRQVGLMGVTDLPDGVGMLFLMDGPVDHGFWMRDTPVPLDIAYVGSDGRIVAIRQMAPCVDYEVAREDCPSYPPGAVYDRTVEVRQGWLEETGVTVGDEVVVGSTG